MKREYIVHKNGKSFVLYAGILDLAHQQGLKSITTDLIQIPNEQTNRVAICKATVVMLGADGIERTFTGYGDAAPNNVSPAMQTCLLRMAETRSKARALRDAVNLGAAAFEELPDAEFSSDGMEERSEVRPAARPAATSSSMTATVRPGACLHCTVSNAAKGNHHKPGCPNRTAERAARV